ncbi:TPA: hypothetical protein JLK53_003276 [Escherichia coli]|nr:hypothetical protein [Escherichia coli]
MDNHIKSKENISVYNPAHSQEIRENSEKNYKSINIKDVNINYILTDKYGISSVEVVPYSIHKVTEIKKELKNSIININNFLSADNDSITASLTSDKKSSNFKLPDILDILDSLPPKQQAILELQLHNFSKWFLADAKSQALFNIIYWDMTTQQNREMMLTSFVQVMGTGLGAAAGLLTSVTSAGMSFWAANKPQQQTALPTTDEFINQLENEKIQLNQKVESLTERINNLPPGNVEKPTLENELKALQEKISDKGNKLSEINDKQNDINNLKKEIKSISDEIDNIKYAKEHKKYEEDIEFDDFDENGKNQPPEKVINQTNKENQIKQKESQIKECEKKIKKMEMDIKGITGYVEAENNNKKAAFATRIEKSAAALTAVSHVINAVIQSTGKFISTFPEAHKELAEQSKLTMQRTAQAERDDLERWISDLRQAFTLMRDVLQNVYSALDATTRFK